MVSDHMIRFASLMRRYGERIREYLGGKGLGDYGNHLSTIRPIKPISQQHERRDRRG
jgi:hypothetical protein